MEKLFYTPQEVAKLLHTSPQTVRLALQSKTWDFPFLMCGNRMKISKSAIDDWLKRKGTADNGQ